MICKSGTDWTSTGTSLTAVEPKHKGSVPENAIRNELDRITESPVFIQSERLIQFLRFTVETTLDGRDETLKEYAIGTHVYGRRPSYQPTEDSIVRSEARRLRRKLQEFYETTGKNDLVLIHYRPGSYVPAFRMRDKVSTAPITLDGLGGLYNEEPGLRVAVMPFLDLSKGALSAACARLLTDDLIHELIRTEGVRVITASSDGPPEKTQGAHIVFEGTVGEDGNNLRVTTSIVNSNGLRIWSERFETGRDPHQAFNISAKIASALISRICLVQPNLIPVHPLVLRAEALLDEGTLAGTQAALGKWQEVTQIDPGCARAICGIAQSYCEIALRGASDSAVSISKANQAAERAVQLDCDLIEVHTCRGASLALSWKWSEAEVSFRQARDLGEHAGTYRQYAMFLAARGRLREAWNYIQRAQQIDPFSYRQKVLYTRLLYLARNYEDGLRYMSEQLLYGRLPDEAELYRALMLLSHNRCDEARRVAEELLGKASGQPALMSGAAEVLAACGETDDANRIAADLNLFAPKSPISKFRQALLLLALGDGDRAISLLTAAYEEHEAELIWLACDPRLDTIRQDSRFTALLDGVMSDPHTRGKLITVI